MNTPEAPATKQSVIKWAGERFGVEAGKVLEILRATAFKQTGQNAVPATDAEMGALLIVAKMYDLNPFTKEIYAFKDRQRGIVPIVSVDGWSKLVNGQRDPQTGAQALDGIEFEEGEEFDCPDPGPDGKVRKAFKWVKCRMYIKGRSKPVEVCEYFDEVYQPPRGENKFAGPWQTHPKRMHRHKAYIQCGRVAFSFGGIYDEDEGLRVIDGGAVTPVAADGPLLTGEHLPAASRTGQLADALKKQAAGADTVTVEGVPVLCGERVVGVVQTAHGLAGLADWISEDGEIFVVKEITADAVKVEKRAIVKPPAAAEKAPETVEEIKAAVAAASTQDQASLLLNAIMKLPDCPERKSLSDSWNAKVLEIAGKAKPKGKPAGTAQQADALVDEMEAAKVIAKLDEISDRCRGYTWTPNQKKLLDEKYAERVKALTP